MKFPMNLFRRKQQVPVLTGSTSSSKLLSPHSSFGVAESYRSLRTNLMYSGRNEEKPVFAVISASPNEGKSLNCANIAISFAQLGRRVLLLDCDMRNPTQGRIFNMKNRHGVSEYLAGLYSEPLAQPTAYENLFVMAAGKIPPNPTELLSGERFAQLIAYARANYDYVFVDLPPLTIVTDALIVAPKMSGYIFVVEMGKSDVRAIHDSIDSLKSVSATVVGFVLNEMNPKTGGYYRRSYKYDYRYDGKGRYGYRYGRYVVHDYGSYGYASSAAAGSLSAADGGETARTDEKPEQ